MTVRECLKGSEDCHMLRKTEVEGMASVLVWTSFCVVLVKPQNYLEIYPSHTEEDYQNSTPLRTLQIQLKKGPHSTIEVHSALLLDTETSEWFHTRQMCIQGGSFLRSWVDLLSSYLHEDNRVE